MLGVLLRTKCLFLRVTKMILNKRSISIFLKFVYVISIRKTIAMITKTKIEQIKSALQKHTLAINNIFGDKIIT